MSDRVLYEMAVGPDSNDGFTHGTYYEGWLVRVEPSRTVWVDEDGLIRERGLPAGRYALVRLEGNDE